MEGYLKKWINPFLQWRDRYFILHEDCLIYSDSQGGQKKGTIHLKIADIIQVTDDPLKIIINSGTKQIEVRASSVEQKVKWYNSLKEAQMRTQDEFEQLSFELLKDSTRNSKNIHPQLKKMLLDTNSDKIDKLLIEAYEAGARFDETLSELLPLICSNPKIEVLIDKLQNEAHLIKVTQILQYHLNPQNDNLQIKKITKETTFTHEIIILILYFFIIQFPKKYNYIIVSYVPLHSRIHNL